MTYEEFKAKFQCELAPQQEAAVRQTEGPVLLLAVPGSGKTTVIVARLGYMLYCQGLEAQKILTMTYTVAATNDMRRRFADKFGDEYGDDLEFRTINGVCARIIQYYEHIRRRKAFELISSDADLSKIIRELYISLNSKYPTDNDIKEIKTLITYCKNMQLHEDDIKRLKLDGADFFAVYNAYSKWLTAHKKMDFDDQLVYAQTILKACPDILSHFQNKYRYINVDEAQDTSKIQHVVIQLLAQKHRNLFMVGDEDQSIYGFRAAYPQALLDFKESYPEATILLMEKNYRSTKSIVERANIFIKRNKSRYDKNMTTDNDRGLPIKHTILPDYNKQYHYLANTAADNKCETAILYRNNDSAIPLIDLLNKKGISYCCRQAEGLFFSNYIVSDIINTIRFALAPNSGALFQTLYYKYNCALSKATVAAALVRHSSAPERSVLDVLLEDETLEPWMVGKVKALRTHFLRIKEGSSFSAVNRIEKYMGYGQYLESRHADMSRINVLLALASQNPGLNAFLDRMNALAAIVNAGNNDNSSKFILSTIHSSKGLEYEKVILIDVIDGLFPSIPEPTFGEPLNKEEMATLEEERRLFYVGVTRAKQQLEIISYEREHGAPAKPTSLFITSMLPPKTLPAQSARNNVNPNKPQHSRQSDVEDRAKKYMPNTRVKHSVFGSGLLMEKDGRYILIRFEDGKTKKLDLNICLQKELISISL